MRYSLLSRLAYLLLATGLWSCVRDHISPPAAERNRLKQETVTYPDGTVFFTTFFTYDSLNRLRSATYSFRYNNPGSSDTLRSDRGFFTYDAQNRLVRYDYSIDHHLSCCVPPTVYGRRTVITYDDARRSANIEEYEALSDFGNFRPLTKKRVEFGLTNEVIKEIEIGIDDGSEAPVSYTYTGGNLTKAQSTNAQSVYEYDTAPNAYYGLSTPAFSALIQYSKNNLIKSTTVLQYPQPDGSVLTNTVTTVYQNSYNAKGLLVKSVSTITPPQRGNSFSANTRNFQYETY